MKRLRPIGLLIGVGLFVWILVQSDLQAVWTTLKAVHWRFGVILGFYIVIFGLDTWGWRHTFSPQIQPRLRWLSLFRLRLAGEALNYVTPTSFIGGEPVKAMLLKKRHGIELHDGVASVVIAKTTFAVSMLLFVMVGLAVAFMTQSVNAQVMRWVWVVLPAMSALIGFFLLIQFFQPFRRSGGILKRWIPHWMEKLESWDETIARFYRQSPLSVFWSLSFHFLGWMAGAVEVYLILLFVGSPVSAATALSIEALWVLLRSGAFLIPATLGVSEGIILLICSGIGVPPVSALALALIRRGRELTWMGLGLAECARK